MKRFLLHLSIPALVAVGAFASALRFEGFSTGGLLFYVLLGFFYYSAPHFLWAFIAVLSKVPSAVFHAGLIAANIAFFVIVSVSFSGAHDPSGLPLQWVAYWPGAVVLQVIAVSVTAVAVRGQRVRT